MLIDILNSIFEDCAYQRFRGPPAGIDEHVVVIALAKSIASVKFSTGSVIVEKAEQSPPLTLHL
jgi:hypothetical protein